MSEENKAYDATLIMDRINPFFIKLAKRLQQIVCGCPKGMSIITVSIMIVDGEPIVWTHPEINTLTTFEPDRNKDLFHMKMRELYK